jgi:hypothetical protein
MLWLLARLHVLPGITTRASLLDWRLRLAGRKPPQDGLRPPSIRVSEAPGADARRLAEAPENGCAAKHTTEAWCRVAPSDRRLLSARCSDGRPGPVLDATLPSSPVFCCESCIAARTPGYAAVPLPAPVALAFTLARQFVRRAPAGTSPCSTYLHNAISSLRARATTPTLRARLPW